MITKIFTTLVPAQTLEADCKHGIRSFGPLSLLRCSTAFGVWLGPLKFDIPR